MIVVARVLLAAYEQGEFRPIKICFPAGIGGVPHWRWTGSNFIVFVWENWRVYSGRPFLGGGRFGRFKYAFMLELEVSSVTDVPLVCF